MGGGRCDLQRQRLPCFCSRSFSSSGSCDMLTGGTVLTFFLYRFFYMLSRSDRNPAKRTNSLFGYKGEGGGMQMALFCGCLCFLYFFHFIYVYCSCSSVMFRRRIKEVVYLTQREESSKKN